MGTGSFAWGERSSGLWGAWMAGFGGNGIGGWSSRECDHEMLEDDTGIDIEETKGVTTRGEVAEGKGDDGGVAEDIRCPDGGGVFVPFAGGSGVEGRG